MNDQNVETKPIRDREVTLVTLLSQEDRILIDRVVLGETPAHQVAGDPWATTMLRRIAEDVVVRDYLCSFAHTEAGARRALGLALGLSRMAERRGAAGAASLGAAGWCALSLGRWELADTLGIQCLKAVENYSLAILLREAVAGRWSAELLDIEPDVTEGLVRRCSADVLRRVTQPRAFVRLD